MYFHFYMFLILIIAGIVADSLIGLLRRAGVSMWGRCVLGAVFVVLFCLFVTQPARAAEAYERSTGTVTYDPNSQAVNEVAVRTVECMQERMTFTMRYGATDARKIADDAALMCGSMLVSLLGNGEKSARVVLALANVVLRNMAGVRVSK